MSIPVIIPLGAGSKSGNDELRILLRSVERHLRGYGEIYLVTMCPPEWVRNVTVVPIGDPYPHNKDANLHHKTLKTLEMYDIGDFIWTADDAVIMQDVEAVAIPILYNPKTKESYMQAGAAGKWRRRVQNTFSYLDARGIHLYWNYEVHCPQLFDGRLLREKMKGVDYASGAGLTIYNTWRGLTDTWRRAAPQTLYKATYEIALYDDYKTDDLGAKMLVGYNDATFLNGLRERLFEIYKEKSRYEQ